MVQLTVEHVLPRNPGDGWKDVVAKNPTFCEEYTFRLGNICLLTSVNRRIGNAPFEQKKLAYAKSELALTKEIAKEKVWTPQQVEERQKRLAKYAVALWRFV